MAGKIVLHIGMSLDGFFEGPDADISWHRMNEELHSYVNQRLKVMGAFLEGRTSYELMEGYWPTADADPGAAPPVVEFAQIWREMPKVVYSSTLREVGPNATLVPEVDSDEVRRLAARASGDLVVGGATLAAAFRELGLVDEYVILVNPVILGAGRPLFPATGPQTDLRLLETKTFSNGVVMLHYAVADGSGQREP